MERMHEIIFDEPHHQAHPEKSLLPPFDWFTAESFLPRDMDINKKQHASHVI